jgi:hypothetical protein
VAGPTRLPIGAALRDDGDSGKLFCVNPHLDEMIRRNLRKTPEERVETLMAALCEVEARGWWPTVDRKAKEQRILCSIRAKSSRR